MLWLRGEGGEPGVWRSSHRFQLCRPHRFSWAFSVSGLWESELGTFAHDKWRKFTSGQVSFLLPALMPFRSGVTRAMGFALVPMSTAAWQQVLRDLVALAGSCQLAPTPSARTVHVQLPPLLCQCATLTSRFAAQARVKPHVLASIRHALLRSASNFYELTWHDLLQVRSSLPGEISFPHADAAQSATVSQQAGANTPV